MEKTSVANALNGAVHRTIPKRFTDVSVTSSNGTQSLATFAGQWIYMRAITADVTIRLGTGNTIANTGEGYVLGVNDTAIHEFFVDSGGELVLNHRAGSACTLRILHD
jgi:hypothetical protein